MHGWSGERQPRTCFRTYKQTATTVTTSEANATFVPVDKPSFSSCLTASDFAFAVEVAFAVTFVVVVVVVVVVIVVVVVVVVGIVVGIEVVIVLFGK